MSKWNAITLYDNEPMSFYRETYSWKGGIEKIIDMMYRGVGSSDEPIKDAEMLEKEYKKVIRLTRKEMLRLLSLTDNALLDYELH